MFILNDRDMHSLERTDEDNTVMMLQMDLELFRKILSGSAGSVFRGGYGRRQGGESFCAPQYPGGDHDGDPAKRAGL